MSDACKICRESGITRACRLGYKECEHLKDKHKEASQIDISKAIEVIKDLNYRLVKDGITKQTNDLAIQALQEKQEREQGWIPVSKRLPENKVRVLVVRAIGIIDIGFCNRNSNNEWCDGGGYKMDIPTAWQPLPKPYKEG